MSYSIDAVIERGKLFCVVFFSIKIQQTKRKQKQKQQQQQQQKTTRKQMLHLWNKALNSPVYLCRTCFMLYANHSAYVCAVINKRCNSAFCSCLEEQKSGSHSTLLQYALKSLTVGSRHFYSDNGMSIPSSFIITCVCNRSPGNVLGLLIPSIIHTYNKKTGLTCKKKVRI